MAFDNGTLLQVVAPELSLRNPGSTCDSHTYKAKSTQNMNFCENVKTRGHAKIHTELKSSDPLDIRLYHKRSIFTPVGHRCEVH